MGNPRPPARGDQLKHVLLALAGSCCLSWPKIGVTASDQPVFTLHGMTRIEHNVDPGTYRPGDSFTESEIWAKGDAVRQETEYAEEKLIQIQRGELIYSFSPEDSFGMVIRARGRLGTMGLVRQIE